MLHNMQMVGHLDNWKEFCEEGKWHPLANAFPLMDEDSLDSLSEDIKINGLYNPVILFEGKVLDGRNRLLASANAERPPMFCVWKDPNPEGFVTSQNIYRRNITQTEEYVAYTEMGVSPLGKKRMRYKDKLDTVKELVDDLIDKLKQGEMTATTAIEKLHQLVDGKAIKDCMTNSQAAKLLFYLMPREIMTKAYNDAVEQLQGHNTLEQFMKAFETLEDKGQ